MTNDNSDIRDEEARIHISMHSYALDGHQSGGLTRKSSFLFFNKNQRDNVSHRTSGYTDAQPFVPSHSAIGSLLGELSFSVQVTRGKGVIKTHSLTTNHGKKEVAKLKLQTGLFLEEDFQYEEVVAQRAPPPPPDVPEFADFVNIMIQSNMVHPFLEVSRYAKLIFISLDLEKVLDGLSQSWPPLFRF